MDSNKKTSQSSSSLSRKKLDKANLEFIESLVEKDTKTRNAKKTKNNQADNKTKNSTNSVNTSSKKDGTKYSTNMDVTDLEYINEENIKSHSSRARRNRFVIVMLTSLLALLIGGFAMYFLLAKQQSNVFFYSHGDGSVSFVLDGAELDKFKTPSDMRGFAVFNFTKKTSTEATEEERYLKLKIKSAGSYEVKFKIDVYQNEQKVDGIFVYYLSQLFEREINGDGAFTGYYKTKYSVSGEQTINLCLGFAMEDLEYRESLNTDNCKIEVHTYLTKVA